jgi:hypothetical protein
MSRIYGVGPILDHSLGVERIIDAFESGWRAGASLSGSQMDRFVAADPNLQIFWFDGFHAAQARIGSSGSVMAETDDCPITSDERVDPGAVEHRLSYPVARALHAAYQAAGRSPPHDSVTAMLAELDLLSRPT